LYDGLRPWQLPLYGFCQSRFAAFAADFWDCHVDGALALAFIDQEKLAANLAGHTLARQVFYGFLERS
jgi:hypothetical protein